MLPAEVLKQIRAVQLKAGHLVTESLAGNYLSVFKGRGMEFDEVREYVPGDDVRSIDWNVTARMGTPFVKVLREERELTLMLMVDVSPSQGFGAAKRKQELAAETAAVLAFLAIRNHDKVGLVVFDTSVPIGATPEVRMYCAHAAVCCASLVDARPSGPLPGIAHHVVPCRPLHDPVRVVVPARHGPRPAARRARAGHGVRAGRQDFAHCRADEELGLYSCQ